MGTFYFSLEKSVRKEDTFRSCDWAVFLKEKELAIPIQSHERDVYFYRRLIIGLMSKLSTMFRGSSIGQKIPTGNLLRELHSEKFRAGYAMVRGIRFISTISVIGRGQPQVLALLKTSP